MTIREQIEALEEERLSPLAAKSRDAKRKTPIEEDEMRTAYQRDRDRIIHSKAFRRLKHKTQVYFAPGDHYRTRLTHTLEVGQIARTIARSLRLNEDLVEAIAMGHDVGHTPFGHVGEFALRDIVGHFKHNEQSLRVVDVLEKDGQGLNLTEEVRDGILGHTGAHMPRTLEGQIVRLADRIAYLCHDFDDAKRAQILKVEDVPEAVREILGSTPSEMITNMVRDVVTTSMNQREIRMSYQVDSVMQEFRRFMFQNVYLADEIMPDREKAGHVVQHLFCYYMEHPKVLQEEAGIYRILSLTDVVDYVAGLTDQYAIEQFTRKFLPRRWK